MTGAAAATQAVATAVYIPVADLLDRYGVFREMPGDKHIALSFKIFLLIGIANSTPIFAKRLAPALGRAVDGGRTMADGRSVFGASKTLRGILASIVVTTIAAPVFGLPILAGTGVALAAMAGDLFSSFLKRRLGFASSSMCFGLDQIPESLLPCLLMAAFFPLSVIDILAILAGFLVGEILLSRVLFEWGVRERPI